MTQVLFVDDEPAVVQGLRRVFRSKEHRVLTATSGKEGLGILARERVSIVVSDEKMPEMSGSEFLSIVRERYPETIRIMLTGQASMESAIKAINEGEIFRFLNKPVDPDLLGSTIREATQRKRLMDRSARLLDEARRQRQLLREIEARHPGITSLSRAPVKKDFTFEEAPDLDALLYDLELFLVENSSSV